MYKHTAEHTGNADKQRAFGQFADDAATDAAGLKTTLPAVLVAQSVTKNVTKENGG